MELCVLAINFEDFIVVNFKEIYNKKKEVNFVRSTLPTPNLKTEESGTSPNSFKVSWRENVKFPTSNPIQVRAAQRKPTLALLGAPVLSGRQRWVGAGMDVTLSSLPEDNPHQGSPHSLFH